MTVRVGLIGAGNIADAHAEGYERLGGRARVVVTTDERRERTARMARRLGAEVAADWAAVVARPDIDAVDICLPHALHAPVAIAAAEAGKHVTSGRMKTPNLIRAQHQRRADPSRYPGSVLVTGSNIRDYGWGQTLDETQALTGRDLDRIPSEDRATERPDIMAASVPGVLCLAARHSGGRSSARGASPNGGGRRGGTAAD